MITRSQLQQLSGLSRKALRHYEERGLLVPSAEVGISQTAMFESTSVELAHKIKAFRSAGLSVDQIKKTVNGRHAVNFETVFELKKQLNETKTGAIEALNILYAMERRLETEVSERIFGDIWAVGSEMEVSLVDVCPYVQYVAKSLAHEYDPKLPIIAQYFSPIDGKVKVRCMQERSRDRFQNSVDHRTYFIPKKNYLSVIHHGLHGDYFGFQREYDKIERFRSTSSPKQTDSSIEVYQSYFTNCENASEFKTLILN
jgi:DNA-binding transcriptional MerR regulator